MSIKVILLLRLAPFFVGLGGFYALALSVSGASKQTKFAVVAFGVWCMGYAFTWFNNYMDGKSGYLRTTRTALEKALGHALVFVGAIATGYGFSANSKVALLVGLACLWFADDKLNPRVHILQARGRADRRLAPGELTSGEKELLAVVDRERKKNPAAGVVYGSKVVIERLIATMKGPGGVHAESFLCALGAMAGYACQASLREFARSQKLSESTLLMVVEADDRAKYYFGDALNQPLAESKMSVWNVVAAAAREAGCQELPDMNELFAHVAASVGQKHFGVPRVPKEHAPRALPAEFLRKHWLDLAPVARKFCATPGELPVLFAVAIQDSLPFSKGRVSPRTAFTIALESAVPMSKIDFEATARAA